MMAEDSVAARIGLLYVEPKREKSATPVIDAYTKKMATAFANYISTGVLHGSVYEPGAAYFGVHTCSCGANSEAVDFELANGMITNSLCVHYLVWHRDEVSNKDLEMVNTLPDEGAEPSPEMLDHLF